ncbi:MAG: efflux RND transporter periplasmic adaptor subunit [Planctomycetota bacterium]
MDVKKTLLIAGVALVVGLALGYVLFSGGGGTPETTATAAGGDETWYTCGMHPEVLSPTPGDCPQCMMKLTPLNVGDGGDDGGAAAGKDRKILYWVAPMDPSYISEKPGKSPMGMDLVPVYEDEVRGGPSVKIDPVTEQNMGIRTAAVTKGPLVREVRAVGNVDYDETKLGVVTLKIGGYVEKLHVDQTGVMVKKGDALFDMYAPEVVQAQDEYLRTKANYEKASGADKARWKGLYEQARMKLLRWDLSEEQIRELSERGHAKKVMTWRSPFDGIVTHKNAFEGAFFKPGSPLYRIADLSTVWVYVSIYEFEFPWVKVGQQARMELPYFRGQTFTGTVDFIYPYLDPKTRDRRVRLVFENPGLDLVPDMYATVYIESTLAEEAVLVPAEAVLDTGTRQVVFVAKGKGKFDPRDVRVGVESSGGHREVLNGLMPGEIVVTSGQFLLDSESKIKEAIQKMLEARSKKAQGERTEEDDDAGGKVKPKFDAPDGLIPVVAEACPVMGNEPVPDVYADHDGYRVFFCCAGCPARFREEPEKYMEKLERMGALPERTEGADFTVPEGLVPVVAKECPVMGGEPRPEVYADYKGHRFFFCCGGCTKRFLADPGKYIEKLRAQGMEIHLPD